VLVSVLVSVLVLVLVLVKYKTNTLENTLLKNIFWRDFSESFSKKGIFREFLAMTEDLFTNKQQNSAIFRCRACVMSITCENVFKTLAGGWLTKILEKQHRKKVFPVISQNFFPKFPPIIFENPLKSSIIMQCEILLLQKHKTNCDRNVAQKYIGTWKLIMWHQGTRFR